MTWLVRMFRWAVCGAALGLAALTLAALGGLVNGRLDALTHFAPIYLAVAVGLALLSLAMPSPGRPVAAGGAGVAILACLVLMGPELLSLRPLPKAAPRAGDFKVIQFNAWGGGNRTPERAIQWLLRQDADIVVLEEGGQVMDALARRGGYHVSCGNCFAAILSKAAPTWTNTPANWRLPPPPVSTATFAEPGGEITVMGVHRRWPNRPKLYQAEMDELRDQVAGFPRSLLIVAGDFNSTPWSFARRREDAALGLTRRTRALFSWPAERASHNRLPAIAPLLPIDHIYAGPGWRTVSVARGPRLGSDHYPVMVTLRRVAP